MNDFGTVREALQLAAWLRANFPDVEDALADTVEGSVDIQSALYRVLLAAEEDRMAAWGLKSRIDELKARLARIEATEEKKRAIVQSTMEQIGIQKISRPEFSVSLVPSGPKVVITEETALPSDCVRVKSEPDKARIKVLLKAGQFVPGAELSNGGFHLMIRRT